MGNIASNEGSIIDSKKNRYVPHFEATVYGPQLGPKLLPNVCKLGPSCAILEPSWAEVGAKCWGLAGRSWPQVGPMLRPRWIEIVYLGAINQSVAHFLAAALSKTSPPAEAVPV